MENNAFLVGLNIAAKSQIGTGLLLSFFKHIISVRSNTS